MHVRSQVGFSLIELMVTVAIISLLSAIAVPNFNGFRARARQSEAKAALGAIYSSEKAFNMEWSGYFNQLPLIGYAPDGTMRYEVGFNGSLPAPIPAGIPYTPSLIGGTANSFDFIVANGGSFVPCWIDYGGSCKPPPPCPPPSPGHMGCFLVVAGGGYSDILTGSATTTLTSFTAMAVSQNIGSPGANDVWSINEANVLSQVSSGL